MNRVEKAWLIVEGDEWKLTWLMNKIFRLSKKHKVPIHTSVSLRSLELTISVDPVNVAVTIVIFLISLYLSRTKLRSKDKSDDWAREQAKGWVLVEAKGDDPKVDKETKYDEYWEFYLNDAHERKYHCKLWKNCEARYEKIR